MIRLIKHLRILLGKLMAAARVKILEAYSESHRKEIQNDVKELVSADKFYEYLKCWECSLPAYEAHVLCKYHHRLLCSYCFQNLYDKSPNNDLLRGYKCCNHFLEDDPTFASDTITKANEYSIQIKWLETAIGDVKG